METSLPYFTADDHSAAAADAVLGRTREAALSYFNTDTPAAHSPDTASQLAFSLKQTKIVFELKLRPSTWVMEQLATELYAGVCRAPSRVIDPTLQSKASMVLITLLKKLKKHSRRSPEFILDWRRLDHAIRRHFSSPTEFSADFISPSLSTPDLLVSVVKHARRFFQSDASNEILLRTQAVLQSARTTTSTEFYLETYLSSIFLPTLPQLMTVDDANAAVHLFVSLWELLPATTIWWSHICASTLRRLAKRTDIKWLDSALNAVATNAIAILDVVAGSVRVAKPQKISQPTHLSSLLRTSKSTVSCICGKLMGSLSRNSEFTEIYIQPMLASLDSFFHPTNAGKWSTRLGMFLRGLAESLLKLSLEYACERLVELALPLALRMLFSQGANQMIALSIIGDLSWLRPVLLYETIRDRTDTAILNASSGLQLSACISALSYVIHPTILSGPGSASESNITEELLNFGESLAPAIDMNDVSKTIAALRFYAALFTHLPIGYEGHSHQNQTVTVAQLALERVVVLLRSSDGPTRTQTMADRLMYRLIALVSNVIFSNSAPQARLDLLHTVLDKLRGISLSNCYREAAALLQGCLRSCDQTLHALMTCRLSLVDRTHLLSRAVRFAGDSIVGQAEPLFRLISECLSESGDSRESSLLFSGGLRLVKNTLKALTETYPTSPIADASFIGTNTSHKFCSRIRWFQPHPEHVKLVDELLRAAVLPHVNDLNNLRGRDLRRSMKIIREAIKGSASVLDHCDRSHSKVDHQFHLGTSPSAELRAMLSESVRQLRISVKTKLTPSQLINSDMDDLKVTRSKAKLVAALLVRSSCPFSRITLLTNKTRILFSDCKDPRLQGMTKYASHFAVQEKAYLLHLKRAFRDFDGLAPDSRDLPLIVGLLETACHNAEFFDFVRSDVLAAIRPRPWLQGTILTKCLELFRSSPSEQSFKALASLLKTKYFIHRAFRSYSSLSSYCEAIISACTQDVPKVQSLIMPVIGELVANARVLPLSTESDRDALSKLLHDCLRKLEEPSSLVRVRVASFILLIAFMPSDSRVLEHVSTSSLVAATWSHLFDPTPILRVLAKRLLICLYALPQTRSPSGSAELLGSAPGWSGLRKLFSQFSLEHEVVGVFDDAEQAKSTQIQARLQVAGHSTQANLFGAASLEATASRHLLRYPHHWSSSRLSTLGFGGSAVVQDEEKFSRINVDTWRALLSCHGTPEAAISSALAMFPLVSRPNIVTAAEFLCGASHVVGVQRQTLSSLLEMWRASQTPFLEYPLPIATQYILQRVGTALEHQFFQELGDIKSIVSPDAERNLRLLTCCVVEIPQSISTPWAQRITEFVFPAGNTLPSVPASLRPSWVLLCLVWIKASRITGLSSVSDPLERMRLAMTTAESWDSSQKLLFLQFMDIWTHLHACAETELLEVFPEFYRVTFILQQDASEEVKKRAILVATKLGFSFFARAKTVEEWLSCILEQMAAPSWKLKVPALPSLQVVCFTHRFLLSKQVKGRALDCVQLCLRDGTPEVREAARTCFTSLLLSFDVVHSPLRDSLIEQFSAVVRATAPKTMSSEYLRSLLAALSGLSAMVQARPYDVPDWMPSVLETVARCSHRAAPVGELARKCVAEFWRTHGDEFFRYEALFSSSQLSAIRNHSAASYFA